jgi:hypothetical protein
MKSKQDTSHTTLQPVYNSLFGAKDFEFDFTQVPKDKIELRKKSIYESQFKNLGIDPSNETQIEELKAFIAEHTNMVELGKFLFGEDFKLNDPRKGIDEEAVFNQFNSLNKQYGYFKTFDKNSEEFKQYLACYEVCLYKAKVIEHNDNGNEVYDRAYKMLLLFPKGNNKNLFTAVDNFIPQYASHLPRPIHDLFQHEIPKANTYDLNKWRELVHKKGEYIIQNLANAPKVEEILGEAPKTVEKLEEALSEISYPRAKENLELAKLCKHYKVPEEIFNRSLDLIKDGTIKIKSKDNIPSVIVDIGNEVDEGLKGYYLVKLPAGDLRGLILGKITNCCQSVGCYGEKYAIKGTVGEDTGFYLLLKSNNKNQKVDFSKFEWRDLERNFTISGQGNIWRGENGSMTVGCWENQNPTGHDIIAVKSLPILADKMMKEDSSIERFTLGLGGKTPKRFKDQYAQVQYDAPKDGFFDNDASEQVALKETEELIRVKEELAKRTEIKEQGHILTAKQGQMILGLEGKTLKRLIESKEYHLLTSVNLPLTSVHIANYKEGPKKFQESIIEILSIKESDERRFKLLTSSKAIAAYQTDKVSIQDLKDLNNERIKVLTSREVVEAYKTGKVSVTDLKDLNNARIGVLISRDALETYKTGKVSVQDLKDLDNEKIKLLTSWEALETYKTGKVSVQDLKDLDNEKIKLLTSWAAVESYKTGKVSVQDLRDLDDEKCKLLTSNGVRKAYETEKMSIQDLKDLDNEKIELLTSWEAVESYKTGKVNVQDLKDLDNEKIKLLTSLDAFGAYVSGKVSIQDLKDLDNEKIKLLTSWAVIETYKEGQVNIKDLKDLDIEKIELLISWDAKEAYKTNTVSLQDLKGLDSEKIKLLTSNEALKAYKTGKVSFQDLKDLDHKEFKLLLSSKAIWLYSNKDLKPKDLKGLTDEMMIAHLKRSINYHDKNISDKDFIKTYFLAANIGKNLFSSKADLRGEDIYNIQESLLKVITKVKTENPNFDISKLNPGEIEWERLGYAHGSGLSGIYYDASSYTTKGYITGEVHIPKVNLTQEVKDKLERYIKVTSNQSQDLISRGG